MANTLPSRPWRVAAAVLAVATLLTALADQLPAAGALLLVTITTLQIGQLRETSRRLRVRGRGRGRR